MILSRFVIGPFVTKNKRTKKEHFFSNSGTMTFQADHHLRPNTFLLSLSLFGSSFPHCLFPVAFLFPCKDRLDFKQMATFIIWILDSYATCFFSLYQFSVHKVLSKEELLTRETQRDTQRMRKEYHIRKHVMFLSLLSLSLSLILFRMIEVRILSQNRKLPKDGR